MWPTADTLTSSRKRWHKVRRSSGSPARWMIAAISSTLTEASAGAPSRRPSPPLEHAVEVCRVAEVRNFFDVTAAHLGYAYALSGRLQEGVVLIEEALADPEATGTTHHPLLLTYLGEAH